MPLVAVKDKFQVTIPAPLRKELGLAVGDLLEITREDDRLVLRPKAVVDRAAIVRQLEEILAGAPRRLPEDEGRSEEEILEDIVKDIKEARRERRRRG
jgi:AbrB family looped-hinge helix DNA binding protein